MKRSYVGVIMLSVVLLLNIVFTQQVVHAFYFEKYGLVLIYAGLNIVLLPFAVWMYRRERNYG
ncbi:hypothetical protein [Paenibacillus sp. YYML68]|uniref:hypothetical protein n=1 Tax=Paenibacillus sp. YYML68 TaxID=2909250 RepID=UPI002492DAAF|nr:hypothetical protein [Paenibacillus sp. YYML68]